MSFYPRLPRYQIETPCCLGLPLQTRELIRRFGSRMVDVRCEARCPVCRRQQFQFALSRHHPDQVLVWCTGCEDRGLENLSAFRRFRNVLVAPFSCEVP